MRIIIKLMVCFSILVSSVYADEKEEMHLLARTMQAFQSRQSHEIWPHFNLQSLPTVVHYKNGHAYAFLFPGSPKNWKRLFIDQYPVLFSENQTSLLQVPLHPAYKVEGQKAFVFSMDQSPDFSLLTFIHERFHLHQFRYFSQLHETRGEYLDHQNVTNLSMMELENKLLTRFLECREENQKRIYLKSFLAVVAIRRPMLHAKSIEWEDHQQKMEGTADYVSLKTYQVFPFMMDFDAEKTLLKMRSKKISPSLYQDVVKGRNYFVGTVICLALDFCHVHGWKKQVANGTKSLHQLLAEALPLTVLEQEMLLSEMVKEFDYDLIEAQIRDKLNEEKRQLGILQDSFKQQAGIAIRVGLPKQHTTSGGRFENSFHFADTKISRKETSTAMSEDQRWTLNFDAIPMVFQDKQGVRLFKLEDAVLEVDGVEIVLFEIQQKTFSTITLKSPHCNLKASIPGKIYFSAGTLHIEF